MWRRVVLWRACQVRYNKGETILKQGEVGETFYMMKSGQVTVAKDGQEIAKLAQVRRWKPMHLG